ncbi:MAG: hypothetical protein HYZ37_14585 [Candidatus Solibacter usitatus]|nr:hypothetical protein [Candidatus Solibacter usitatus]
MATAFVTEAPAIFPVRRVKSQMLLGWLFPNAAVSVSLIALFLCLFSGEGPAKLFRDADTGWHIRNGESILAAGSLPRVDPYSFSKAGQPWFAWEWGADALMGIANQWRGLSGVALLYSAVIALTVFAWFSMNWSAGGNFLLACAFASPMLTTLSLHWLARPHLFGWLLAVVSLLFLERSGPRFRFLHGLCFFVGGVVWANLHASFFLLPFFSLLYAAGALLRRAVWGDCERTPASFFLYAALLSLAGSFVNPYGWYLHEHVISYLGNPELLSRVGEFQSFNFHVEGAGQVVLTLVLAVMCAPLTLARKRPEHFLLCCALSVMALRSARVLPLVALLLLPIANAAFTDALRKARVGEKLRQALDSSLAYTDRLRILDSQFAGYATALAVFLLASVLLSTPSIAAQTGFPAKEFPVQASAAVEALPESARILAPDKFGGYLIYRFRGKRKVFFDGRSDFYGAEFMKQYIRLVESRPGWLEQVERIGFTHALLPNNYSLVAGLQQAGWVVIYRDGTATLLRRN